MKTKESITLETQKAIEEFIKEHANKPISYRDKREARQLYIKAMNELFDSIKDYSEELNNIVKEYIQAKQDLMKLYPDTYEVRAVGLTYETNKKLAELQAKDPYNHELREFIDRLKKYWTK